MGATTLNWIQIDELRVTLLVMVALLSWVVLRYTWRNFALEPSRPRLRDLQSAMVPSLVGFVQLWS